MNVGPGIVILAVFDEHEIRSTEFLVDLREGIAVAGVTCVVDSEIRTLDIYAAPEGGVGTP